MMTDGDDRGDAEGPVAASVEPSRSQAYEVLKSQFRLRTALVGLTIASVLLALLRNPYTYAAAMLLIAAACGVLDYFIYGLVKRQVRRLADAGRSPLRSAVPAASLGVACIMTTMMPALAAAESVGDVADALKNGGIVRFLVSAAIIALTFIVGWVSLTLFAALSLMCIFDFLRRCLRDLSVLLSAYVVSAMLGALVFTALSLPFSLVSQSERTFDAKWLSGAKFTAVLGLLLGATATHAHLAIMEYQRRAQGILHRYRPPAES